MYGGGFDMIATLAAKVLPFGLFETRRLVGALVGLIGLFATWRLGRRLGGPFAGLIALVLVATCPLYYGHMFINPKDGPFAAVMVIALLGLVRAFEEYPRPTPPTLVLCGLGFGLSIGARVLGGFALMEALFPLPLILAIRTRASGWKSALAEGGTFLVPFIPAAIFAYLLMGLVWPWSVVSPLNPFRAVEYFSTVFEKPWRELFAGQLIPVDDMPRSYVPTLFALQVPELMLVLGLCGLVGALIFVARGDDKNGADAGRRAAVFAVVLAATLPIIIAVMTRPVVYNGIRHIVFVLPPFAVLGGLAAAWIAPAAGGLRQKRRHRRRSRSDRGCRLPDRRHGAAASLRIHRLQPSRRRRARRAQEFHARLLGPVVQTGAQQLPPLSRTDRRAGRTACGRSRSAARTRRSRSRSAAANSTSSGIPRTPTSPWCSANSTAPSSMRRCCSTSSATASPMRASMTCAAATITSLLTVPGIDKTNY